ncbi:hypothetical protein ACVCL0_14905 [Rhodanobacter sp. UC4450_H17]
MAVASACARWWITSPHECLDIVIDPSLRGEHVAEAMARLLAQRSPAAIKVDNGSEFAGKVMDR